jgi:hypothetical protein
VWSNEEISDDKITVYHLIFERFPAETVKDAAIRYMTVGKFFPRPADLLELIAGDVLPEISHGEAWAMVQKQINRHGANNGDRAVFDHPAVAEAVAAVGWKRLCLEETRYIIGEFNKALDATQDRQRRGVQDGTSALESGNVTALPGRAAD